MVIRIQRANRNDFLFQSKSFHPFLVEAVWHPSITRVARVSRNYKIGSEAERNPSGSLSSPGGIRHRIFMDDEQEEVGPLFSKQLAPLMGDQNPVQSYLAAVDLADLIVDFLRDLRANPKDQELVCELYSDLV